MNQLLNTWNWIMYLEYSKITTIEFFYRRLWYHKKVVKWVTYETVKCKFIWLSHLRVAWKWLVSFGKTHANIQNGKKLKSSLLTTNPNYCLFANFLLLKRRKKSEKSSRSRSSSSLCRREYVHCIGKFLLGLWSNIMPVSLFLRLTY